MSTTTQTERGPDVNEMVVIHRVFRREFAAIPTLVRRVRAGDQRQAELVLEHLRLIMSGLHMHHTGEDAVLWPLLLERAGPPTELVDVMLEQHERVDGYASQIEPLAASWASRPTAVQGEQLARLIEEFASALVEHLDLEEREILPLVSRHLTVAEWDSLGEHGKDAMSARQLPLLFGAILEDADDGERKRMLAHLPAPIRVVMRTFGAWQYRRYITRVRAE